MRRASRKQKYAVVAVVVAVLVGVAFGVWFVFRGTDAAQTTATLRTGAGTGAAKSFTLEVVSSDDELARGLGARSSLAADRGMLFKYAGGTQKRCIWMKDMKFPIDVIWLNADKRVVSAVSNMKPESYPTQYCAESESVIELPAGAIREQGIRTGQIVSF